ncbi:MAG: catalase, partial [Pedobacter sp.]
PGIDFTNDPLLQGRLFSYTDTQLIRLGGPNFHEIPINRPVVPVHNNQRDGYMRQTINRGKTSYGPNGIANQDPQQVKAADGGFVSYNERIDAKKIRARSRSFFDHFSQARLFFNSQSDPEKNHIIDALSFELGKVKAVEIRERMLAVLAQIDKGLAAEVAYALGLHIPEIALEDLNNSIPADADRADYASENPEGSLAKSDALSMAGTVKDTIKTRKIAILAADGVDEKAISTVKTALVAEGAIVHIIAPKLGEIISKGDQKIVPDESFLTAASVLYDAVYVAGGANSVATLEAEANAVHFLNEAFKHCKAIAADNEAIQVLESTYFHKKLPAEYSKETVLREGVIVSGDLKELTSTFIEMIALHRFWERENPRKIPA